MRTVLALAACSRTGSVPRKHVNLRLHVAPYERGALAHPTMTSAVLDGPAAGPVHAVHEGATEAEAPSPRVECGCN